MTPITLRRATRKDGETIWRWRADPATARASLAQGVPPLGVHLGWYNAAVEDPNHVFFIGLVAQEKIGFVRLDRNADTAMIAITLDAGARGRKLSVPFLLSALKACPWPIRRFTSVVRPENAASRALFERCGFTLVSDGNPLRYERGSEHCKPARSAHNRP